MSLPGENGLSLFRHQNIFNQQCWLSAVSGDINDTKQVSEFIIYNTSSTLVVIQSSSEKISSPGVIGTTVLSRIPFECKIRYLRQLWWKNLQL